MSSKHERRLLCAVLHDEARTNPHRLFAIAAKTNDIADGYHFVTFQQVEKAVNHLSRWLEAKFESGGKASPGTTLCYIGVPDLRYCMITYAAIKCRYKVFLPSPRNTSDVNVAMLEQTLCSRLVYANEVETVVEALIPSMGNLVCEPISTVKELLNLPDATYPYDFDYSQLWKEPIIVLHSSGSTGLPKTVTWTHGTVAAVDFRDWPTVEGRRNHDFATSLRFSNRHEGRLLDPFPPFHAGGVMTKVLTPIWNLTVVIFGPAQRPPSGGLIGQMMRELKPNGVLIPPSIGEQVLQETDSKELFSELDYAMFGGGPISKEAAFKISAWTTIISAFGSTETIHVRQLVTAPDDFDYVEFHPEERLELQPIGNDLYEMVFQIREEFANDLAVYHNFPTLSEWRSRDLFEKHPIKPNLWKFYGRVDDILVFSSGEKLCPLPMEMAISSIPSVSGALVVGQGLSQPILIIELAPDKGALRVEDLWPAVEAANALLPDFGRISKSKILFTDPSRPLKRATKGTIIRKLSEDLYAKDIEMLVEPQHTTITPTIFMPSTFRPQDIESAIRSILQEISIDPEIGNSDNLYACGMNSIRTAEVLGRIKTSLEASKPGIQLDWLTMETLYLHPTISQLALVLLSYLNNGIIPAKPNRTLGMQRLLHEYTANLPSAISQVLESGVPERRLNVVVTGTTGFFGPYVLNHLLKMSQINRIYCLNRSTKASQEFDKHGCGDRAKNVVFFHCDTSAPKLGLSDHEYTQLVENSSVILHNAWTVDFNLPIDAFRANLQSVRNLIELSVSAVLRPRIILVSTIGATGAWTPQGMAQKTVPESFVEDLSTTLQNGYAESKRVAEHILEAAASKGISATVIRVGHLVPDAKGSLPEQDYLTAFLRTCKDLGLVASDVVDIVDWLPVSAAAEAVADIVEYEFANVTDTSPRVLNLVNPEKTLWDEIVPIVEIWAGKHTKHISMCDWVDVLKKKRLTSGYASKRFPALLMLPLFEMLAERGPGDSYEQTKLLTISPAMNAVAAIKGDSVRSWLSRL